MPHYSFVKCYQGKKSQEIGYFSSHEHVTLNFIKQVCKGNKLQSECNEKMSQSVNGAHGEWAIWRLCSYRLQGALRCIDFLYNDQIMLFLSTKCFSSENLLNFPFCNAWKCPSNLSLNFLLIRSWTKNTKALLRRNYQSPEWLFY